MAPLDAAFEIDRDRLVERLFGLVGRQRVPFVGPRGVVEGTVDPPKMLDGAGDQLLGIAGLGDIGGHEQRRAAGRLDLAHGVASLFGAAGGPADAGVAASHHRDLADETGHGRSGRGWRVGAEVGADVVNRAVGGADGALLPAHQMGRVIAGQE
jgi:hypothetical protein